MSFAAFAVAVLVLAGPKPEPTKPSIPDPDCAGGTELRRFAEGTEVTKYCAKPNGEKEGPFVNIYTVTNTVQKLGTYHRDSLHGSWSSWDSAGTLREQGSYQEGYRRGFWTWFHANGKKASSGEYGANGMRGVWSKWSEEGKLIEEGEYRNELKHGIWTTYDPKTGKILTSIEYANGVERPKR